MTTTKEEVARYISKYAQLRLVRKASYNKEVDGRVVAMPGEAVRFNDGIYETSDPDEIAFLDNHPNITTDTRKGIFMKIPKGTDAQKARAKDLETLEERNKRLDEREAELAAREARLGLGKEEGGKVEKVSNLPKVSNRMKVEELMAIAVAEDVDVVEGANKTQIVEAIEKKREANPPKGTGQTPQF